MCSYRGHLTAGEESFRRCVEAMGCPAAVQATAKGMFPETHPQYLGIYWGVVSSHRVATRLKHADALLVVGT
jgi:pyruvate decarboxylase